MVRLHFAQQRILTRDFPRREYHPTKDVSSDDHVVKSLHYGQRKLLLSEVELLSALFERREKEADDRPFLVVYAGAANGSHLPILFDLFPLVKFVLIDPASFCPSVQDISKRKSGPIVELIEDYCTDELCLRLRRSYGEEYEMVLVSDIRSGVPKRMSNQEHTEMILRDNRLQFGWCYSLRPSVAMLKFHPPYPAETNPASCRFEGSDNTEDRMEYLDGCALFGVWAPKSSSEVRLVVEGPFSTEQPLPQRTYSCREHEQQCYHYNTSDRYQRDCESERIILQQYISLHPNETSGVTELSRMISARLSYPLFQPLAEGSTEDHMRWVTLLYSTRDAAALEWYKPLRDAMTLDVVVGLVRRYADAADVPVGEFVGDVELTIDFWRAFCKGDFSDNYSMPSVRWKCFASLFPPKNTGPGKGNKGYARRKRDRKGA